MTPTRFLYVSDIHVPHHDPTFIDWVEARIAEYKPDVLIDGGDLWDSNAASRWPNEYSHTLEDEYRMADEVLKRFRGAAGDKTKLVKLHGNHEANGQAQNRIPKDLRSLTHWGKHMPEIAHWEQHPYDPTNDPRCTYRIGQVAFVHGWDTSPAGIKATAFTHGRDYGLLVQGHAHRPTPGPVPVEAFGVPLNRWYAVSGCGVDLNQPMGYMARNVRALSQWGQAIVVGEAMPLKSPREGRYWDAEVITRAKAGDRNAVCNWRSAIGQENAA